MIFIPYYLYAISAVPAVFALRSKAGGGSGGKFLYFPMLQENRNKR